MNTFERRQPEEPLEARRERGKRRSDLTIIAVLVLATLGAIASFVLLAFDLGGPLPPEITGKPAVPEGASK